MNIIWLQSKTHIKGKHVLVVEVPTCYCIEHQLEKYC